MHPKFCNGTTQGSVWGISKYQKNVVSETGGGGAPLLVRAPGLCLVAIERHLGLSYGIIGNGDIVQQGKQITLVK